MIATFPHTIRQWVSILSLLALLVGCAFGSSAQERPLTIAIIQPYNISAYHEAVEGFIEQLRRQLKQDFQTVVYESPDGLYAAMQQRKLITDGSGVDLILTVGTQATAEVSERVTDTPIVFTMVLNSEQIAQHAPNMVGASLNIPVELQFGMIKEVLPTAKNVGVIYDPQRNRRFVEDSARIASQLGFRLKQFPVTSQKDIPEALERVSKEADVLWGIVDDTVYTSRTTVSIIQTTWKKHIPFIGTSEPYVKAGALWALVFESKDIGRQSATLATQILSGASVATLQETIPRKIGWIVNLRTAKLIGVEFPRKIIDQAWEAYE
jgi:putative ABC transport system substrate-binding protein